MKKFYTVVVAILVLLATSMPATAQGVGTPNKEPSHSDFSLGTGLAFGAMHSQGMLGAYLDAAIGKSRIDLNIADEVTFPLVVFYTNVPEPSFNRISLTYGRELLDGQISLILAAGAAYTFGVRDGKYLYSTGFVPSTDYYESIPISRVGLTLDANVDVPVSRHFAFGLRSSLTIDNVETYGLFGMTFGYTFN